MSQLTPDAAKRKRKRKKEREKEVLGLIVKEIESNAELRGAEKLISESICV